MIAGQKLWRNAAKPVFQRGRCSLLKAEAARFLSHSNANSHSTVDSNNTPQMRVVPKLRHVTLVPAAMTGNYRWLSHFSSHRPVIGSSEKMIAFQVSAKISREEYFLDSLASLAFYSSNDFCPFV